MNKIVFFALVLALCLLSEASSELRKRRRKVDPIAGAKCGGPSNKRCHTMALCCAAKAEAEGDCYYASVRNSPPNKPQTDVPTLRLICSNPAQPVRVIKGEVENMIEVLPGAWQKQSDVLRAGLSMGTENGQTPLYWTLGVVLCDPKSPGQFYGLSNAHNFLQDDEATLSALGTSVTNPSRHPQDQAGTSGPRVVGKLKLLEYSMMGSPDASIVEINKDVKVAAEVLTPNGPKKVIGMMTEAEIETWLDAGTDKKQLAWLSGRSSGWSPVKLSKRAGAEWFNEDFTTKPVLGLSNEKGGAVTSALGGAPINSRYGVPGNSGSVLWKEEATGFKAVALLSTDGGIFVPVDTYLKHFATKGLALEVCTADKVADPSKIGKAKTTDDIPSPKRAAPAQTGAKTTDDIPQRR